MPFGSRNQIASKSAHSCATDGGRSASMRERREDMKWNAALMLSYTKPISGREAKAMEVFADALTMYGKLAADGKCAEPEVFHHLVGGGCSSSRRRITKPHVRSSRWTTFARCSKSPRSRSRTSTSRCRHRRAADAEHVAVHRNRHGTRLHLSLNLREAPWWGMPLSAHPLSAAGAFGVP